LKKLLSIGRYLLLLALTIGLLYLAFRGLDLAELKGILLRADYTWVGISLLMGIVAYWSRAYRWKLLLAPMGHNPSTTNAFISLMIGYIANLALPRLGEVLRCTALNRLEKIPIEACLGTVVAERIMDMIMLLLMLLLALVLEFDVLSGFLMSLFSSKDQGAESSNALYWILAAAAFGLFLLWFLLRKYSHLLASNKFYNKALGFAKGIGQGLTSVARLEQKGAFLFHTLLIWVMYFGMTYIVFRAMPETEHLSLGTGLAVLVIGGLGMAAPVQGGMGAFHWLVSHALLLYGIPLVTGSGLAVLLHESQTLLVVLVGGICLIWSMLRLRKANQNQVAADVNEQ
jgi:uncharacterized membrane protein YbhN (UPF0104 family)